MLALKTELTADFIQPLDLRLGKLLRAAQLIGYVEELCVKLYRLHLMIGIEQ